MKVRKINQNVTIRGEAGINPLFERLQNEFRYLLGTDITADMTCTRDERVISELQEIMRTEMNSVTFFVANEGNGKTMTLQQSYDCFDDNRIVLKPEERTIVIPMFFRNFLPEAVFTSKAEGIKKIRFAMERQIAAASRMLEKNYPLAKAWFRQDGRKSEFCDFIQESNPKLLESPDNKEDESVDGMLEAAMVNDYLTYMASKLKFHLVKGVLEFNRILIVLDSLEFLDETLRSSAILQCLHFYEKMRYFPVHENCKEIFINLVISVRQNTYYNLKRAGVFKNYEEAPVIYKEQRIDLSEYFREKISRLPEEEKKKNKAKWSEALRIVTALTEKFEKKYSGMIVGLADLSLPKALKICEGVLSNSVWTTKGAKTDPTGSESFNEYVWNNITVIRAIACGSNRVYVGGEDNLIPNVFYNTPEEDNALFSLYIMAYFVRRYADFGRSEMVWSGKENMLQDFKDIFTGCIKAEEVNSRFEEIAGYLSRCGILCGTDKEIKISAKGLEIWDMLAADSVLMELYREDYYQVYTSPDADAFKSSFDLMQENRQETIFRELLKKIECFLKTERAMIEVIKSNGAYNKYISLFGKESMSGHLLSGVNRSIDYSGKYKISEVYGERKRLEEEISNMIQIE